MERDRPAPAHPHGRLDAHDLTEQGLVAFSRDAATIAGAAVDGSNGVSLWRTG